MLLRNKTRKLQLGGSLDQAKNAYAPIDIRWKQFDLTSSKPQPLDLPAGAYSASGRSGSAASGQFGGIPSDIAYVDNQLSFWRDKLKTNLSGENSKEYADSAEFKNDSEQINKWASAKASMLKSREENYKATRTRLQKSTGDDYAMFGGKALVRDSSEGGAYKIIDSSDMLTERVKDADGVLKARYIPATVGEALKLRYEDVNFSGFNEETGGVLDGILSNVLDTGTIEEDMDKMFKSAGSVNESAGTFISNRTGGAVSISDLIRDLEEAGDAYTKVNIGTKSNASNLATAVQIFRDNMNPSQIEALRNKATARFVNMYGSKNVDEQSANQWIDSQVNAQIAERAKVFLKTSYAKSIKTDSAGSASGADLDKLKISTNRITLARMEWDGKTYGTIEADYSGADDIEGKKNLFAKMQATTIPISDVVVKDQKGTDSLLVSNPIISKLTGGELKNNLFLADEDSTPVADLSKGNGLSEAIVNQEGGPVKILKGVPYTIDQNGRKQIAWKEISNYIAWGKKFKELKDKSPNTPDEEIIKQTSAELGYDLYQDPNIHEGDVAMIPIIVNDRGRGFSDSKGYDVLSSDLTSGEEAAAEIFTKMMRSDSVKKTFAFTVLDDSYASTLPEAYGPQFSINEQIPVKQIIESSRSNQTKSRKGVDLVSLVIKNASYDPTKQ